MHDIIAKFPEIINAILEKISKPSSSSKIEKAKLKMITKIKSANSELSRIINDKT